jgi:hypothetical protein
MAERYFSGLKPPDLHVCWRGEPCRSFAAPGARTRGNSRFSGTRMSGSTARVGASKLSESYGIVAVILFEGLLSPQTGSAGHSGANVVT